VILIWTEALRHKALAFECRNVKGKDAVRSERRKEGFFYFGQVLIAFSHHERGSTEET
jgi:hypothetical protein